MNLGTPKDSSKTEVRKYLKTFLSDRRVIKIHPIIWKPILNGIILNIRPKKSAKLYQKICTENGFPLLEYTEKQMENLKNICPEVEYFPILSKSNARPDSDFCHRFLFEPSLSHGKCRYY